jgi:hypothetical protein
MIWTIKNRFTNKVMHEVEADTFLKAVERKSDSLSSADLSGADLSGANLRGSDLSGANLSGSNLSCADLSGAYLHDANLSGSNLSGAFLYGANLSNANLSGANLSNADLSGANLHGANLYGANLYSAKGIEPYRTTPLLVFLDQPGKIRAYKLTDADGWSPIQTSNRIKYKIGKSVTVESPNADPLVHCGSGINVATLDWCMKEWQPGYRIFVVEFTAKDIACIPTATDGKFRLSYCEVVGEKDLKEIGLIKEEVKDDN